MQTEPTLIFPLITDIHYMSATQAPESIQDAIVNIGYFTHEISCLGVINLGDNTDGDTPQAETLQRNAYLNQLFQGIGIPYYPCIGNHDDNRYYSLLNLNQIKQSYLSLTHDVIMDSSMSGTNYYKDFFLKHPLINPKTFLGDAAFDTAALYPQLLTGNTFGNNKHFRKAYIPLNSRAGLEKQDYKINENGIPCCPHDDSLPMKYEGISKLRSGVIRYKFVCPQIKWIKKSIYWQVPASLHM